MSHALPQPGAGVAFKRQTNATSRPDSAQGTKAKCAPFNQTVASPGLGGADRRAAGEGYFFQPGHPFSAAGDANSVSIPTAALPGVREGILRRNWLAASWQHAPPGPWQSSGLFRQLLARRVVLSIVRAALRRR